MALLRKIAGLLLSLCLCGVVEAANTTTFNPFTNNLDYVTDTTALGNVTGTNATFTNLNCTTFTNGGAVTTNAAGVLICSNDDTGGGSTNSFETWAVPAGSNPVADASTDTVTFTQTSPVVITGTASTDTINFAITQNAGTDITADLEEEGAINTTAVSNNAANSNLLVSTGTNTASWVALSNDATLSTTGQLVIAAKAVNLKIDTTGPFVQRLNTTSPIVGGQSSDVEGAILTLSLTQSAGTDITADLEEEGQIAATAVSNNAISPQLLVGTGSNTASWVTMSNDATITNTGALVIAAKAVNLKIDTTGPFVQRVNTVSPIVGGQSSDVEGSILSLSLTQNAGTDVTADLEEEGQINATAVSNNAASPQLLFGTGSNTASWVTLSNNATVTNTGAIAIAANAVTGGDLYLAHQVRGSVPYYGITWQALAPGTTGQFLMTQGAGLDPVWGTPSGGTTHAILSSTHTDTVAASVNRGDLIVGNSTPAWARFAVGANNSVLTANGTDPAWSTTPTIAGLTISASAPNILLTPSSGDQIEESAFNSMYTLARISGGTATDLFRIDKDGTAHIPKDLNLDDATPHVRWHLTPGGWDFEASASNTSQWTLSAISPEGAPTDVMRIDGDQTVALLKVRETRCGVIENLVAADDNMPAGMFNAPVTVTSGWCKCDGTCTTPATIAFENDSGTAMTHGTITCAVAPARPTPVAITAGNTLLPRQGIRFDTTNTPSPTTDKYTVCYAYTQGAREP